jgi:carbamate kinase
MVDPDDSAFNNANKAIGPGMTQAQAEGHRDRDGWQIRDEGKGRFRRVVPSPMPRKIIEMPAIEHLVNAGQIVVCCGGGGIPVAVDTMGRVRGVAAVIDKDRTTGLLARQLEAPTLVILTAVEYACINFGKPGEQRLKQITADHAETYMNAGQFGTGSMRPKIEAAIDFVRRSSNADALAIIAHVNHFAEALDGRSGTHITK